MSDPDMVTTGEDIEVFVSHSTAEREIADNIVSRLEAAGHGCWLAHRDASPGDDWAASIVSAIADSRLVVLIYSASANRSQQVLREMERAVSSNRPIIPLIIEEAPMSKAMEYFLGAAHWINVSGAEQEKAVTAAVATIERLLGRTDNLLPAPIRPVMSLTLQAMYGAVTLAGVVFAVSIYRFFFNSLSETALVAMSALWVPTIVFGVYGLVWGREAVIKSLIAAAISGAALVVLITLVCLAPFITLACFGARHTHVRLRRRGRTRHYFHMLVAKEWSSHKQQRDRAAKIDVRVGGVLRPADLAGETGGRTVTTGSARIERNLDRAHT